MKILHNGIIITPEHELVLKHDMYFGVPSSILLKQLQDKGIIITLHGPFTEKVYGFKKKREVFRVVFNGWFRKPAIKNKPIEYSYGLTVTSTAQQAYDRVALHIKDSLNRGYGVAKLLDVTGVEDLTWFIFDKKQKILIQK